MPLDKVSTLAEELIELSRLRTGNVRYSLTL